MSAVEPIYRLLGINKIKLTTEHKDILEMEFFYQIFNSVKGYFHNTYKNYFLMLQLTKEQEDDMLDGNLARYMVSDILSTEEYTIEGLACYLGVNEDVIYSIISGYNNYPSAILLRKILEIHRVVKRDLYEAIFLQIKENFAIEKDKYAAL